MNAEPRVAAADWLARTYGGLVVLAGEEPFAEGAHTWLFACRYADDELNAAEPPLNSTVAVPKDGSEPLPVANSHPLDEQANLAGTETGTQPWRWRVNARNCLIATDAAVDGRPASALAWSPEDEAPGWWSRLLATHFPDAEVISCPDWTAVARAIVDGGPGTRGVVWLRRGFGGVEITGHLLYAQYRAGDALFVDGQAGTLARLRDDEVGELVLARFHRPDEVVADPVVAPWQTAAPDLASAVEKATNWLAGAYADEVVLVEPDAADETSRGWLFACTTRRYRESGDWRDQMLDAALVVPKAPGESPFGLPNPDPWSWFERWNAGEAGLPEPPRAGSAAWFDPTMRQLGSVLGTNDHPDWAGALDEIAGFPPDVRALVWVRRRDNRGRETVGNLVLAANEPDGVRLIDSMTEGGQPVLDTESLALQVIRFQ